MKSIYREYDIRGIFGTELNEETVKKIGYFLGKKIGASKTVAIGYDARTHSPTLFGYLASGFNHADVRVLDLGMCPTPVSYFAGFQDFNGVTPSATVMITGSHNPPEYNGFKITIENAPFFGEQIYALGDLILASDVVVPTNPKANKVDALDRYIAFLTDHFKDLRGFPQKIAYDCGNGVAGIALEKILANLELNSTVLYPEPDGTFPNHHPDPSEEENLHDIKEAMKKGGEAYGFAYDGDADRIAMLSQKYNFKGDILALFLARHIKNPTVIGEVKCSQVMYDEINKFGKAIMYKTGHSNLKVKIKETNASFAAEVSGHLFFNDRYFGYDDAIYATFRLLELIKAGFAFDAELEKLPVVFSTDELKVTTTEEKKFGIIDQVKNALKNPPADMPAIREIVDIDGVRVIFADGWGLIRASNTTPVLVTRFEAKSQESLAKIQESMTKLLKSFL